MFRNQKQKKTFLFITGSWHSAWCLRKITPLLEADGHAVFIPILPGHEQGFSSFKGINLESYVNFLKGFIGKNIKGKFTLVLHSAGGVYGTQLAEILSDRVEQIIYIAAYVPENGNSLFDEVKISSSRLHEGCFEFDRPNNSVSLKKVTVREIFYNDCEEKVAEEAMNLLQPEPIQPMRDPIRISKNFENVAKVYFLCALDRVIAPQDQERMAKRANAKIVRIETGHSPFWSNPNLLVTTILQQIVPASRKALKVGFFVAATVLTAVAGSKIIPKLLETPRSKM